MLVTGVTRYIGSALCGQLALLPGIDRVIGVDAVLPEPDARARMGNAEFARADIRNPLISRIIDAAGVDTVVHASASSTPASSAARSMAKEMNVLGTMQLLAACQGSATVSRLIVRSTAAVYGGSSRDPAVMTEDMVARRVPSAGPARDAIDIEGYVRSFGRRRPDVRVAVPRFADIIGPSLHTPLTRYFSLSPLVPVTVGRDARLQFVHESDAVGVLRRLVTDHDFTGVVNVAGDGALTVAQAIHRAGRIPLPVPGPALGAIGPVLKLARIRGFSSEQPRLLASGRVLDTTRLRVDLGYLMRYTTAEAFDDFAASLSRSVDPVTVGRVERRLSAALGVVPPHEEGQGDSARRTASSSRPRLVGMDGGLARGGRGR